MNINIDLNDKFIMIKDSNIILGPWLESDLYDFYSYASVEGVGQMAGWKPHNNICETQKVLDKFIKEKRCFAIVNNGRVIGSIEVKKYNDEWIPELYEKKGCELGFVLCKDYWGLGIMTNIVNLELSRKA